MAQGTMMRPPMSFRPKPAGKPAFGKKMMADGGGPGLGAPEPFGAGGPPPPAPMPPPGADPGADPDMDSDTDSPAIKPESVNYHDDPQSCGTCSYMGDGGQCAVLKMQVSPEGACNAFEAKGGQGDQPAGDDGGLPEDGMDDMGGPPPGGPPPR